MQKTSSDTVLNHQCVTRILNSDCFARSPQARRFLQYVAERALEGDGDNLKAYTIGLQALGVNTERSCPETNARMQASRVRRLLVKYYQTEGQADPVQLILPTGVYEPRFLVRETIGRSTSSETPSLAVLDFENLSFDPGDLHFCRGLFEATFGLLVQCPHLRVTRLGKDEQIDSDYVLRTAVTKSGNRVRIACHLSLPRNGETLWSDHIDHQLSPQDMILEQDELAERLATIVGDPALGAVAEQQRLLPQTSVQVRAFDAFYTLLRNPSEKNLLTAKVAIEACLPQANASAMPHAAYATVLAMSYFTQSPNRKSHLLAAEAHARLAITNDSRCAHAHFAKALIFYHHREEACAKREIARAYELAATSALLRGLCGLLLAAVGKWSDGIALINRASSQLALPGYLHAASCLQHLLEGSAASALSFAEQLDWDDNVWSPTLTAVCHSRLGHLADARRAAAKIAAQSPSFAKRPRKFLMDALFLPELIDVLDSGLTDAGLGSSHRPVRPVYKVSVSRKELPKEIRVGILQSLSGTMALSEAHLVNAAMLAIDEINQNGGVLGRPVRAIVEDGASDAAMFRAKAQSLIKTHQTTSIFGCWTSSSRKAVLPVVEENDALLWYPLQYEGLEKSRNVVYTGSCLNQQIEPAVRWVQKQGRNRCYIVGSDYVFPRTANRLIRALVESAGGTVVGSAYQPLGAARFDGVAEEIAALKPDIVYNTVNGSDNVALFSALFAARVKSSVSPLMSFSLSELELAQCGSAAQGHWACWSYFQSMDSPKNRALLSRFRERYGQGEVLSDPAVTAYAQVHLWKDVVERAECLETDALLSHLTGSKLLLGDEELEVVENNHVQRRAIIGQASGRQFDVIWQSPRPILPQPWLGVDQTDFLSRDLILGALQALPEMAALSSVGTHG